MKGGLWSKSNYAKSRLHKIIDRLSSRVPNSNWVRITWANTEEMDKYAPLEIHPKPETVIRAFLDFEGFEQYQELSPQYLKKTERIGFTVVEWGGRLLETGNITINH